MAEFYIAWVGEAETAALSAKELFDMEAVGELVDETPVREASEATWSKWLRVKERIRDSIARGPSNTVVSLSSTRATLRENTAYFELRVCFGVFFYLDIACIVVLCVAAFFGVPVFCAELAAGCALAAIPLSLSNAFLDLVDSAIQLSARK
jgi:small-conductance mechanosensitive channel